MKLSSSVVTTYRAIGVPRASSLEGAPLASFRARASAFVFDLFVVLVLVVLAGLPYALRNRTDDPSGHITVPFEPFHSLWGLVALVFYFGLATWLGHGQTPGKRLLRIRVVSLVHEHLSLWHCVERALGYGFLQYFIHPNRQTVHDRIAETIVVATAPKSAGAA